MKKVVKNIVVEILTGLHIGAGNDSVQIGGVDSAVIKDPRTNLPYIPGSSIKGKIRCLLETEGGFSEKDDTINTFFGPSTEYLSKKKNDSKYAQTPTRFIFQDLFLIEQDAELFKSGELNTEIKTEIKIDRAKGSAEDRGLRSIERVPPKTTFEGKLLIRHNSEEELQSLYIVLNKAIELLNNDYLGGSGSRGYGAVSVKIS